MVNSLIAGEDLFTWNDTDGNSAKLYSFRDNGSGGGEIWLNGIAQAADSWITVAADKLGDISYNTGSTPGLYSLDVRVFDGKFWSSPARSFVESQARPVISEGTPGGQGLTSIASASTVIEDVDLNRLCSADFPG